jgi:hypothetical protein
LLIAPTYKIEIKGVKSTLQILNAVQPGVIRELRKDIVRIAQPAVSAIKSRIPRSAPLSGMNHYGRTRFGGVEVRAVLDLRDSRKNYSLTNIQVISQKDAAGFEIVDMAGRKTMKQGPQLPYEYKGRGRIGGSGRQNPTKSRPVVRRGNAAPFSYRINGQGKAMINNLPGIPSRYVYPALGGKVEGMAADMLKVVLSYASVINKKLRA